MQSHKQVVATIDKSKVIPYNDVIIFLEQDKSVMFQKSYSCKHAQDHHHYQINKRKKKNSLLSKKYLMTKCNKAIKFLSYLYPEEAEIPLLDEKKISLVDLVCNTHTDTRKIRPSPFLRTRFISAAEGTISSTGKIFKVTSFICCEVHISI